MKEELLRELARRIEAAGYLLKTSGLNGNCVTVSWRDQPLFRLVGEEVYLLGGPGHLSAKSSYIQAIYEEVREYVLAYLQAPELPGAETDRYKLLTAYGGTALAAHYTNEAGYTFLAQDLKADATADPNRQNYADFTTAKEEFALRSGLLAPRRHLLRRPGSESPSTYTLSFALEIANGETRDYDCDIRAESYADALSAGWRQICTGLPDLAHYAQVRFLGMHWLSCPTDLQDYLNQLYAEADLLQNRAAAMDHDDADELALVGHLLLEGPLKMMLAMRLYDDFKHYTELYPPDCHLALSCCEKARDTVFAANPSQQAYLDQAITSAREGDSSQAILYYEQGMLDIENGEEVCLLCAPAAIWNLREGKPCLDVYQGQPYATHPGPPPQTAAGQLYYWPKQLDDEDI